MRSSNSELRAQLGNCLKHLSKSLAELCDYLPARAGEAWVWRGPAASGGNTESEDTLCEIATALRAITYEDAQDAHASRVWPGIVALPSEGLVLADEINARKQALARALKAMEGREEVGIVDQRTGERGARPLREVALEGFHYRRLHYWQATRRIEILRPSPDSMLAPEYVGFMWATSREVRRTSREEVIRRHEDADSLFLPEEELDIISALPAGEPLAWVRPGNTTPKANVRWCLEGNSPISKVKIAVLPFLVPGLQLPSRLRQLPPAPRAAHTRLSRTDIELEDRPILTSKPLYRYLERYRAEKRSQSATGAPG